MSNDFHKFSWLQRKRKFVLMPLLATGLLLLAILWRMVNPAQVLVATLAPIELSAPSAVTQFEARLQRNPEDVQAYALLGQSLLQRVRETGDSSLYARAGQAFEQAIERDPNNLDALIGQGMLAAALHEFPDALIWAEAARTINPWRAEPLGIMVDGYIELGQYDEAVTAAQQMVDLRPGLDSYSRVSYVRELYGDVDGAIQAMQAAVDAGVPGTEAVLWSQIQLGNLYFSQGDSIKAEQIYQATLEARPNYVYGRAGLARLKAAQGDYSVAAGILEAITIQLPLPEFITDLANVYDALEMPGLAQEQRNLVRVMQQLNEAAGMNVDLELAAFEVEHGSNPQDALELARLAYESRPTIFAADTLAWALFKNGQVEEAKRYSEEALRLGTQDPILHQHADAIVQAIE